SNTLTYEMAKAGRGKVSASQVFTTAHSVGFDAGGAAGLACSMRRHTFSANRGGRGDVTCHSRRSLLTGPGSSFGRFAFITLVARTAGLPPSVPGWMMSKD